MNTRKGLISILTSAIMAVTLLVPVTDVAFATETTGTTATTTSGVFQPVAPPVDASYDGKNATKVPVIAYHMLVSNKNKKKNFNRKSSLCISQGKFKKQMKWLHDHNWRTLSMEEFYLWHQGKIKVPKKSVVITFDDGDYSVIKYALPVLKKYNMRATMFMVGNQTKAKTKKSVNRRGRCKRTGVDVMKQVQATYPNFEFQSHTYAMHSRRNGKSKAVRFSEARQMKDFKRQQKKFNYTYLAYPFGSYSKKTINAAKANGIKMAFTYGKNAYAKKSQSVYKIRRIKIAANDPMRKFTRWFK